jgi:hypothetical protein
MLNKIRLPNKKKRKKEEEEEEEVSLWRGTPP